MHPILCDQKVFFIKFQMRKVDRRLREDRASSKPENSGDQRGEADGQRPQVLPDRREGLSEPGILPLDGLVEQPDLVESPRPDRPTVSASHDLQLEQDLR